MNSFRLILTATVVAAGLASGGANAALTPFQTYVGSYGVSTDGWGSLSNTGTISASVPTGATVTAAFLYTSTANNGTLSGVGGSLAGATVDYATLGTIPSPACCSLTAARANVTNIIKPLVDGGAGGIYNFSITETSSSQDGSALVVVYALPSLITTTIGILDGFSLTTGDTTSVNFATPLNPSTPGFSSEMRLGIGFSFDGTGCTGQGQSSTVRVNGTLITENAGCNDDSADIQPGNGNLITVGGFDDLFSNLLPSIAQDSERYNLVPYINAGDTSIIVNTANSSQNDNVFLAVFQVTGEAGINEPPPTDVPEPATLSLFALALVAAGIHRRRITKRV